MSLNKRGNDYAAAFGKLYETTPKAVFAAIAFSYVSAGGDKQDLAIRTFIHEWHALYVNGIVPQKPPGEESDTEEEPNDSNLS